ncbi:hypothetical protein [Amycolatopsis sp. lyj-90]|uniref:hypothetical protein n=1 Tax=Amycolatopsis sp. lyj-90 TaxID=2789285 RepID=UPI003978091F
MNVSFGYGDSFEELYEEINTKIGKLLTDLLHWDWSITHLEAGRYSSAEIETLAAQRNKAKRDVEELLYQADRILSRARTL